MYIDSDGTCHYFKYKSGSGTTILYEDEFYPSRIITRYSDSSGNTTSFKLNDGSNIETFFTFNGFMNRKCDITNGKQMWVEFVSGTALVSKVHDGGGHIISFEYDGNNYLTKMTDPAGRSTTFTYTSGRLTKITRPGNRNINLSYNTNGSLSSVTDVYGAKVNIEYWTNTYNGSNSLLRVKTLTEKGLNGTDGQKLSFDYNAGQTIVTDRNSRKERLMFDHLGHTVSCEDPDGNGAFCKYSTPEQYTGLSNTTNLHLLNYDIKAQGTVRNYVPNADFEDSSLSPWVFENSTESGTGSASKNTSEKYAGNASMKVQSTSLTGRYGYQNPLTIPNVAVGKVYTISAYVKVTSITLSNSSLSGAIVYFGYHTADGWKLVRSKPIQSVTDGWVRISATMTVPSNWDSTYRIIAKAGIDQAIGTAYFDNVQVEEGSVANNYNLLDNGYFRDAAGTATPFAWTGAGLNSTNDKVYKDGTGWYYKITGERLKYKSLQQTVTISGNSGDKFTFGAWVRANAMNIPDPNGQDYRALAVRITFVNTNGTEGAKSY
ncbi:MAG: carbohydrate binding domain-containing protein, partial [Clostridia bacterium]|nr:carbohydrate binding domain-containing protein [Clostridia bacterium]